MPTFRVELCQRILETCLVTIEAATAEQAAEMAISQAEDGRVEWSFYDHLDDCPHPEMRETHQVPALEG